MKWDKQFGSTQTTSDGRYCIVHATETNWVAYLMGATVAKDLGTRDTDIGARDLCEAHEAQLVAAHRRTG